MRNPGSLVQTPEMPFTECAVPPLVRGKFVDFDDLTENTADWDIDFRQVGKGSLTAELLQMLDPQLSFASARFDQCCLQSGAAPEGTRTFAILDNGAPDTRFCGQSLTVDTLGIFSKFGEFESTSPSGFNVFTLSFDESWLAEMSQHIARKPLEDFLPDSAAVLPYDPGLIEPIRNQLRLLKNLLEGEVPIAAGSGLVPQVKEELATGMLNLMRGREPSDWIRGRCQRHALLTQAKEFIREHLADPVRVMDVAVSLGITVRTLELIFHDLLNVTPQCYILTLRLYEFHRALKKSTPEQGVAAIAGEWGFWHLGQLAKDYRERFGDLPSQTLARY